MRSWHTCGVSPHPVKARSGDKLRAREVPSPRRDLERRSRRNQGITEDGGTGWRCRMLTQDGMHSVRSAPCR
eukprot:7108949-Prymnesium_polylepis.1